MRLLFIGSIPEHKPGAGQTTGPEHEPLFQAARELGYEAARRNHVVLVGSDSKNTIDVAVAEGVFQFCKEHPDVKRQMEVHRPNDSKIPYQVVPPNLVISRQYYHQDESAPHRWVVTHVRALDECDCVLAVGGGTSTRIVGNIAADRQTPIVAVANFGGTSRELFDRLLYYYKSRVADAVVLQGLVQPWQTGSAGNVIGFAEVLTASAIVRPHLYFLSYSWGDSAIADHIEALFWRNGRRVLRDENNVKTGGSLSGAIETLIKQCDSFVALWGVNYQKSTWCPGELQYARDLQSEIGRPPRIVICNLDDTAVDIRFANTLRADCKERPQRELMVLRLLREEA
jgi:hypothetical protein